MIVMTNKKNSTRASKKQLPIIFFGGIVVLVLVFSFYGKQLLTTKFSNSISGTKSNGIKDSKKYSDTVYNFTLSYPGNYIPNTSQRTVNFRQKDDMTPSEAGFSIIILENPEDNTLKELCQSETNQYGILCTKDIETSTETKNELNWERILNNSAAIAPSGEIRYAIKHSDNLYLIVDYSNKTEEIDAVVSSFQFTD